ncbi:hypothetical protein JCM33374_g911 [Metschnikowia sp. JCM 33374]|nr:hypothetical protein JCM33374_g911 [Metschnikowia sp. JCM 33374]
MATIELCPALTEKLISVQISCPLDTPKVQNDLPSGLQEDDLLQKISPLFSVEKTVYGAGDVLPKKRSPRFRLLDKIYFCSDACRSQFKHHDSDGTLASTICAAEELYLKCAGEISEKDVPANETELLQVFDRKWDSVKEWGARVFRMKPSKRPHHYPTVTADDYAEIRYVISTLHNLARSKAQDQSQFGGVSAGDIPFLESMTPDEAMRFEIEAFNILQSSEMDKVKRYPYLLESYVNIYKFVRLVSPETWLPFVTPQNIRDIIGRNLTNAFGTWSDVTQEGEGREYFGFGVYPSASFFNHSCDNNLKKKRSGSGYEFTTLKEIYPGEELCISYGLNGGEKVAERQEFLREWFFSCGCKKCDFELQNL